MADDEEPLALGGDDSPWAHDLPIAEPAPLPSEWAPASPAAGRMVDVREARWGRPAGQADGDAPAGEPEDAANAPFAPARSSGVLDPLDGEPSVPDAPTPGHRHRRTAVVVGLVGLLAAAVIGSQLAGGGDDPRAEEGDSAATQSSTSSTSEPRPPVIKVPTRNRLRPTTSVANRLPAPPPEWVSSALALDPRVAAIAAPTELVALSRDGMLHLIDTSTGAMQSIDAGMSAINLTMTLGAHDVVLSSYDSPSVSLVRAGALPVRIDLDGGASRVIDGPGEDDFILVPNTWNPESPELLLVGPDGQVSPVSSGPLVEFDPWQIEFIEGTGQMIVNDTGGVYLVDGSGLATRVSTGDLVFNGPNHFVVRECDEALDCAHVRVDHATGQRDIVQLGTLGQYGYGDPTSTSISPDGTAISYFDWTNDGGLPSQNLFELATGADVKVVSADQYNVNTAWAPDSSGMFVVVGRAIVFHDRATGEQIPITSDAGLDDIIAVAARPVSG